MEESYENEKKIPLNERMKSYEDTYDSLLKPNLPVICRIDGHCFSKWTYGFEKPFDARLHDTMVRTSSDLLNYFNDVTMIYTQSDEITMMFPYGIKMFGGRIQKLTSLVASYTAVRFNYHLNDIFGVTLPAHKIGTAHFDARFFTVPTKEEMLNNILWRAKFDCQRNSKNAFAQTFFSPKVLQGLPSNEQIHKVRQEKNIDYYKVVPSWAQYGTTIKRERFEYVGINPRTGFGNTTLRTRPKPYDIQYKEFNAGNLDIIIARYWS